MNKINLGKVSITPRGTYDSAQIYVVLDIVTHLGVTYLCKDPSKLFPNADGWMVLSSTNGLTAYDIALQHGFVGTEKEWISSLSKASEEAAVIALAASADISELATEIVTAETLRVAAEEARELRIEQVIDTAEEATTNANTASGRANTISSNPPKIQNNTWWFYDEIQNKYIDSTLPSKGEDGQDAEGITVIDSLLSTSTTDALSAKQGKILSEKIDNKSNTFIVYFNEIGELVNADSAFFFALSNACKNGFTIQRKQNLDFVTYSFVDNVSDTQIKAVYAPIEQEEYFVRVDDFNFDGTIVNLSTSSTKINIGKLETKDIQGLLGYSSVPTPENGVLLESDSLNVAIKKLYNTGTSIQDGLIPIKTKLDTIAEGSQVNVVEELKIKGHALSDNTVSIVDKIATIDTFTQSEIISKLDSKQEKIDGKGLSAEDYTTEDKLALTNSKSKSFVYAVDHDNSKDLPGVNLLFFTKNVTNNSEQSFPLNISNASTTKDGLISKEDKTKLDSLKNYDDALVLGSIDQIISSKGSPDGIASLDENSKIPVAQLPSYVDDILEFDTFSEFPIEGETGKIYLDLESNNVYRWSGTTYVEISSSLALGETNSTAYPGNKGKINADNITAAQSNISSLNTTILTKANSADVYIKTDADNLFLPKTSYTAADVLTKIKTVDGTGSGLDADLLDGKEADSFVLTTDSRLTNSRPASDVSAWAKEANKPTYTAAEVGALTSGGTAVAATKLATARTINSVNFDGTANIQVPAYVRELSKNEDLNNYNSAGFYSCPFNTSAATILNSPTINSFSLLVEKHAGAKQTLTEYTALPVPKMWFRNYNGNQWTPWYRIWTEADYLPVIVTSLSSLPKDRYNIKATPSTNQTLSFVVNEDVIKNGTCITIKCINTSTSNIIISLPTNAPWMSKDNNGANISSVNILGNGFLEISVWSLDGSYYIKTDA